MPAINAPSAAASTRSHFTQVLHKLFQNNILLPSTAADEYFDHTLKTSRPSVQRKLRRLPPKPPMRIFKPTARKCPGGIRARAPHHVWLADFTTMRWLFGAVIDAFSRKIVAVGISEDEPTAKWTIQLFSRAISWHGSPRHVITDHGCQFTSKAFKSYLKRNRIRHRHGAVGSSQSISVIERFWRSLKSEWATVWLCFAGRAVLERRLREWVTWYNSHRPHSGIGGRTPADAEQGRRRRKPRRVEARPGDRWLLERDLLFGQKAMPVYRLKRAS